MDAKEFFKNLDFENKDYFYHITSAGNGEIMFEEGLLMVENQLRTTTIKITKEMLTDISKFIKDERGNNIRKTDEMIIIACDKEDVNSLVVDNNYISSNWELEDFPSYVIPSEYIVGYIDMRADDEDFIVTMNPNYYDYNYGYIR